MRFANSLTWTVYILGVQNALKYLISTKSPVFNSLISWIVLFENTFKNIKPEKPTTVHNVYEAQFQPPKTNL